MSFELSHEFSATGSALEAGRVSRRASLALVGATSVILWAVIIATVLLAVR